MDEGGKIIGIVRSSANQSKHIFDKEEEAIQKRLFEDPYYKSYIYLFDLVDPNYSCTGISWLHKTIGHPLKTWISLSLAKEIRSTIVTAFFQERSKTTQSIQELLLKGKRFGNDYIGLNESGMRWVQGTINSTLNK